jgi:hypothetical protein
MRQRTSPRFWACYNSLPSEVKLQADRCFKLLKLEPRHPSLHFKKIGRFWSARVGLQFRVLAVEAGSRDLTWVANPPFKNMLYSDFRSWPESLHNKGAKFFIKTEL